jgi:cytochrome P450
MTMAVPVTDLQIPAYSIAGLYKDPVGGKADGHWVVPHPYGYAVLDHEHVTTIMRDRRFHQAIMMLPETSRGATDPTFLGVLERRRRLLANQNGADHDRLRRIVAATFTPKGTDRYRPFMREFINARLDAVAAGGRADVVKDIFHAYPVTVICELLGAPSEDWPFIADCAVKILGVYGADVARDAGDVVEGQNALDDYLFRLVETRRSDLRDDLISLLIQASDEGDRLSTTEVVDMCVAVLVGGTETTRTQLGAAMHLFSLHPDQWDLLGERPELAPQAVEEAMRMITIAVQMSRVATEDIAVDGVLFPKGTLVITSLIRANHDPEAFDHPERFDITRVSGKPQLGFGTGMHTCLGAFIARAEMQEALAVMAGRWRELRPDGEVPWKSLRASSWGPEDVPVAFRDVAAGA